MDKAVKAKWLEALRSGKYRKGKGQLRDRSGRMCCLGVLCDIKPRRGVAWIDRETMVFRGFRDFTGLPEPLLSSLRISFDEHGDLISLNDLTRGWSKVIKYIEDNL